MNFNFKNTYLHANLRGSITHPLVFDPLSYSLQNNWSLNNLNDYANLDCALSLFLTEIYQSCLALKQQNKFNPQQKVVEKVTTNLKALVVIVKKMEFYRIENKWQKLFADANGLYSIIAHANIEQIYLISEVEKYTKKNEMKIMKQAVKGQEHLNIYRDLVIKLSKIILKELKNEIYCPHPQLSFKILKLYGLNYDFSKDLEENYRQSLLDKQVQPSSTSRESLVLFYTFKIANEISGMKGLCFYLSYLKNVLLDRNSGVLSAEYETWMQSYEACLKIYCRNQEVRVKSWLEVDQILSNTHQDNQFQNFLLKKCTDEEVSLSSINFYIKNSRKEEKALLKEVILQKIKALWENDFWKYAEDILEFIEYQTEGEQRIEWIEKMIEEELKVICAQVSSEKVYEVEYGLTFVLENTLKYIKHMDLVISEKNLLVIYEALKGEPTPSQLTLIYRLFNQILTNIYLESISEQLIACTEPVISLIVKILHQLSQLNYVCSKSALKLVLSCLNAENTQQESFWSLMAEVYLTGDYQQNSDLEIVHAEPSQKDHIASELLQLFQVLVQSQLAERKELIKCIEAGEVSEHSTQVQQHSTQFQQHSIYSQSFLNVKAFKDKLLFDSIQHICVALAPNLSLQILEIGLSYCTPLITCRPWRAQQEDICVLSIICEEMPIETLKLLFRKFTEEPSGEWDELKKIPTAIWMSLWKEDRSTFSNAVLKQSITISMYDALCDLRKFEFLLNLMSCVFDKLNQHSQKNIKEIKIIYQKGAHKIQTLLLALTGVFFPALITHFTQICEESSVEELKEIQLFDEDEDNSVIQCALVGKNDLLNLINQFNAIGIVNQKIEAGEIQQLLLPCFAQVNYSQCSPQFGLIGKQLQFFLLCEVSTLTETNSDQYLLRICYQVEKNKTWAKKTQNVISSLQKQLKGTAALLGYEGSSVAVVSQKIQVHLKTMMSKSFLPEMLQFLLTSEVKETESKIYYQILRSTIQLCYSMDTEFEQHFVEMLEKFDELVKKKGVNQDLGYQGRVILSIIELFLDLVLHKVRIRSYHLFRMIKFYLKVSGEEPAVFNSIICTQIRSFFEEFITNYKPIHQIIKLCTPKLVVDQKYAKLLRTEHNLNSIEACCTLSMFINLFCRLNFASLAVGIDKIFQDEESKVIYLDYLNSLTRKIGVENLSILAKDLDIMKIDVYGNLPIITKGNSSDRLINKIISLAKNLLRLKVNLQAINKLPVKLLAEKISLDHLEVGLDQFEEEEKAIPLGAISIHRKLAKHIHSNLHFINLHFLAANHLERVAELNSGLLFIRHSKPEIEKQIKLLKESGHCSPMIHIGKEAVLLVEALIKKIQKYYELSLKDEEYRGKLYSVFKILCISCTNNPEIVWILASAKIWLNQVRISFFQFVAETLKQNIPIFCQFYATILKTNCGFLKYHNLSANLKYELEFKSYLLQQLRTYLESQKQANPFLVEALCFVIKFSSNYRFRSYRFVKNAHQLYEQQAMLFEAQFCESILKIMQGFLSQNYSNSKITSKEVFQLLEVAFEKCMKPKALDLAKVELNLRIQTIFKQVNSEKMVEKENTEPFAFNYQNKPLLNKKTSILESHSLQSQIQDILKSDLNDFTKTTFLAQEYVKNKQVLDLQEEQLTTHDSRELMKKWNDCKFESENTFNEQIIKKFEVYNEEIENRDYMKEMLIFPTSSKCSIGILKDQFQPHHIQDQNSIEALQCDEIIESDSNQSQDEVIQKQDNQGLIQELDEGRFDCIVQECDDIVQGNSDQIIEGNSDQIIEDSQDTSALHSAMQLASHGVVDSNSILQCNEDGSIKLIIEEDISSDQVELHLHQSQPDVEVTKDDIVTLIEDYTLNPEAIKQIAFKIKFVTNAQLTKLHTLYEGEVQHTIAHELQKRGIPIHKRSRLYSNGSCFLDQSKLYRKLNHSQQSSTILQTLSLIPEISKQLVMEWFVVLFNVWSAGANVNEMSLHCNLLKKLMLDCKNSFQFVSVGVAILTSAAHQFEQMLSNKGKAVFDKGAIAEFKEIIVNYFFGTMIESRLALPLIFFGNWCEEGKLVQAETTVRSERVIEILLKTLITCPQRQSQFLVKMCEYTNHFSKVQSSSYPYYPIQDSIPLSNSLAELLSSTMHRNQATFSQNHNFFQLISLMSFFDLSFFSKLMKIEMTKIAHTVKKVFQAEIAIIKLFKKNYAFQEILEVERKAEIYWQMRKVKNCDQFNEEVEFCRKLLTDFSSKVMNKIKQNCFNLYYKHEDLKMKHEVECLKKKLHESESYKISNSLEKELKEKEKQYGFWRKNLLNCLIKEEIVPSVQAVCTQFLGEICESERLYIEVYELFGQDLIKETPILYKQASEFYKMMLAYELIIKEEETSFHSMSILKTLPTLVSAKNMLPNRRRSSLAKCNPHVSMFAGTAKSLTNVLKRSQMYFSFETSLLESDSVLFPIHAKYSNDENKIKYLRKSNSKGEMTIEVRREYIWHDTVAHLGSDFADSDIKIKIAGEMGIDYGGLTREWVTLIAKQIVDPNLGLFSLSANKLAFQPSKYSYLIPNHLSIFHKFGILVGKAMKENWLLEVNFTKSFLKHVLGHTLYVEDLDDIEPHTAKGLLQILKDQDLNAEDLCLNFTYQDEYFGETKTIELMPGGQDVFVDNSNKKQYIKKIAYAKMTQNIREQSLAFIAGVESVIPFDVLKLFNYKDIGKYLAGTPIVSIEDMKKFARYEGFTPENENIIWFWEIMQQKTEQEKADFLFFLTGSYKVPFNGFKENPITINRMSGCKDYLPVAHTCFSVIDLSESRTKEILNRNLKKAICQGKGFSVS